MTTPKVPSQDAAAVKGDRADRAQTIIDWFQINSRLLTIGTVVVAVAAVGYWFWLKSNEIKTANAEKMLVTARQSLASGNTALAQSDLQKVVTRYGSTRPGVEAAMLLAETDYDAGKYADGIKVLQQLSPGGSAKPMRSMIYALIGDGYSQMKKQGEAAKSYEQAAAATDMPAEKAYDTAKAARTYAQAGDTVNAARLWQQLAESKIAGIAAEAKVRLAELTAKPAGKS